jgi:hypothetical protein
MFVFMWCIKRKNEVLGSVVCPHVVCVSLDNVMSLCMLLIDENLKNCV